MLEMQNIDKRFRGVHALNDVSLGIKEKSVVALVGDNGAGKSTLMRCVTGAIHPDSGSILFQGKDLTQSSPEVSRSAGIEMIYQDLSLCRMQDIVTNVFLGREKTTRGFLDQKTMAEQCQSFFADLKIDIPLDSIVGTLSGGQQQSVAIVRAMISKPSLLIMDEPTAALAVKETQKVLGHISTLREQGVSVVIITHNLPEVFEVADRILVMRHGKIKYDLSPEETDLRDLTARILGE